MSAQQIGLAAIFDTKAFDAGIKGYMSSIDKAVSQTNKGAGGMASAWSNLGGAVGKTALALSGAAVVAAGAAGAAITAFVVGGISKAKDLQEQMSNIAAIMNKTTAEVAPLKALILQLGLDPKLKVDATEAANAIEMLARNGLSMDQILNGAAHSTVLLANATGADFGTAANIATDAMAIFKIKAEDMDTAVNGISAVTTNSKFDINDYALALSQGAGVAASAGVSFDDFNTSIAAISPLFGSGSDAGTSFKTMIASLNPKSDEAAKLMNQLGLEFYDAQGNMKSMADIATELNDAFLQEVKFSTEVGGATAEQNKQRKLLESTIQRTNTELYKYSVGINGVAQSEADKAVSIDRLNREHDAAIKAYEGLGIAMGTTVTTTRQLSEEEKNAALTTIFGSDASRSAIALAESGQVVYTDLATATKETGISQDILNQYLEGGITKFELLQAQMSQTDAAEQAATRMDNLAGAMEILQGMIDTIQLKIGEKFLPVLQRMAEGVGAFLESHADQFIAFFDNVAAGVEALIGAGQVFAQFFQTGEQVSAVEFGLSEQSAALADSWVNLAFQVGETIAAIGQTIQPILDAVGRFVEWKDVVIVLAAALVTVIVPAIWGFIAVVGSTLLILAGAILAVAAVRTAWESDFLGIQTTTLAVMQAIQDAIQPALDAFKNFGSGALQEIINFVSGNETQFTNLKAIWDGVKEAASNLFDALNGYLESVVPGWSAITEALSSVVGTYIDQIKLTFNTVVAIWQDAVALVTAVIDGDWAAAWEAAKKLVGAALDFVTGTIQNFVAIAVTLFGPLATAAWQWIVDATPKVLTAIGGMFVSLIGAVGEQLPGWITALSAWGAGALQWISDAAASGLTAISAYLGSLLTEAAAKLPSWIAALGSWALAAWKWIEDAAALVAVKLGTWLINLTTYLTTNLSTWTNGLLAWATAAWQWIIDAAGLVGTKMSAWLTALTGYLTTNLQIWKDKLAAWAEIAWQWIVDAATALPGKLGTWLTALTTYLTNNIGTWTTALAVWATAAWQWIVDAATNLGAKLGEWYTALKTALDAQLENFKAAFTDWKTASTDWLTTQGATITTNVGAWYTSLTTALGSKRLDLKTEMLKFATSLVEWITSSAADALPNLGTWLGKLVAWIPLGVLALGSAMIKMVGALIGWIAGTGGESAVSKTDPELEKFQTALTTGLGKVWEALKIAVQNFAQSFWDTLNTYVDWQALGATIMGKIKLGVITVREAIKTVFTNLAQALYDIVFNTDWLGLGSALLNNVKQGVIDVTGSLLNRMYLIAVGAYNKVINYDWIGLGANIIGGIVQGLKDNASDIWDYLYGVMTEVWHKITGFWQTNSPSKRMAELGKNLIEGWLIGMQQSEAALLAVTSGIVNKVFARVTAAGGDLRKTFTDLAGGLASVGGGFSTALNGEVARLQQMIEAGKLAGHDMRDAIHQLAYLQTDQTNFGFRKDNYDSLKRQLDLINLIKENGGDVQTIFDGIRMGIDVDNQTLLNLTTRSLSFVNQQIETAIRVAQYGYDKFVDELRAGRESVTSVEDEYNNKQINQLQDYRDRIASLDATIASAETELLAVGGPGRKGRLQQLQNEREDAIAQLRTYLSQVQQLEEYKASIQGLLGDSSLGDTFKNNIQAVTDAMTDVRMTSSDRGRLLSDLKTYTDRVAVLAKYAHMKVSSASILEFFNTRNITDVLSQLLDINLAEAERVKLTEKYTAAVEQSASIQRKTDLLSYLQEQQSLLEDISKLATDAGDTDMIRRIFLGTDTSNGLSPDEIATIYGRYMSESVASAQAALFDGLRNIQATVDTAANGYADLIDRLRSERESVDSIEARAQNEKLSGLEAFHDRVVKLDEQIADTEQKLLETGSSAWADHLRQLQTSRQGAAKELESYIIQWKDFSNVYDQASEKLADFGTGTPAADTAAKFFAANIEPLIHQFESSTNTSSARQSIITLLQLGIDRLDQYKSTLNSTVTAQKSFDSLVDNSTFGTTIAANIQPAIDALYSMGLDTGQRSQILYNLDMYRRSITGVVNALDSIKIGGQYMGDLLDTYVKPYAQQLMNINLSGYERAKLTQDYARALATVQTIERRETATADIQQRIDLLQKVNDLADQLGNKDYSRVILGGVDLRSSVTPEQIAGIMQRFSQYAVTAANEQLFSMLDVSTAKDYSAELGRIVNRAVAYDDIVKQFDPTPLTPTDQAKQYLDYYDQQIARLRTLAAQGDASSLSQAQNIMQQRDVIVGYLRTYLDSVYRADLKLATLQTSTNDRAQKMADDYKKQFIDPVVNSMSLLQTPSNQQSLLSTLGMRVDKVNAYITSVEQAAKLEQDISTARGLNPLIGMFAAQRIDPLLERLYDINTTEAQRVVITQQLVAEQQKLVALQEKQQKLDFLQQQLDLFSQIKQLNDQFDDIIPMQSILDGIKFGLDASLDDMLTLTSRSIDAIISTVKAQLGIHSPSKVFAEIGQNIMAGMGQGMQNAFSIPVNALRQSMAIPYALQSRSLAINMGGVNISNGMDETMFEARIHQIVERMF